MFSSSSLVVLLLSLVCLSQAGIFSRSSSSEVSSRSDLVLTATAFLRETADVPSLIMGVANFYQSSEDSDVIVDVFAYGNDEFLLNGNAYGVHIHSYGDVSDRQGDLIGPHFVGNGYDTHGCPPNPIRHAGDLGNFYTTAEGMLNSYLTVPYLQTYSTRNNSIIGRSVAISAIQDGCNDESYSGPAMVIGTIGIPAGAPATVGLDFEPSVLVARFTGTSDCFVCSGTIWIWKEDPDNNPSTANTVIHVRARTYVPPTTSNIHGFTINQFGDISGKNGAFTGNHFDKGNDEHNVPPFFPRHTGDLGNNEFYVPQKGDEVVIAKWLDMEMPDIFDLSEVVGRSVVFHEKMDKGFECPEGGMGAIWGMGVLGIAGPDVSIPKVQGSAVRVNYALGLSEPCSAAGMIQVSFFLFALAAFLQMMF